MGLVFIFSLSTPCKGMEEFIENNQGLMQENNEMGQMVNWDTWSEYPLQGLWEGVENAN